jgi:hypothetical protein
MRAFCVLLLFMALPVPSSATDSDYVPPHVLTEEQPTSVHQFSYHIKPDTDPVSFLMKGVTFRVPRNYLAMLFKYFPFDAAVTFKIMTFYPDFAGSDTEDDGAAVFPQTKEWRYRKWEWIESPNLVVIDGLAFNDPEQQRQNRLVFEAEANEPDHRWKYGLLLSTKSPGAKIPTQLSVYFVRPSQTQDGVVLFCSTNDVLGCQVHVSITPHVWIIYKFHAALLPHWQEIHQHVTSLIKSFITKKEP